MQNVKSVVYPIILVGACLIALITLGFWPVDESVSQTQALREQVSASQDNASKAMQIICVPKFNEKQIDNQGSPLSILNKDCLAPLTASIRENSQADKAQLTLANQLLCKINSTKGFYYQKQITENTGKIHELIIDLDKALLKLANLKSSAQHLSSMQKISDDSIVSALNADLKEIETRKIDLARLKKNLASHNRKRAELERKASSHLEKSSKIRDEIVADVSKKAQKKLEVAISEKALAGEAIDQANNIILKIDEIKGKIKLNETMLAEAQNRAKSEKAELTKRKELKSKLAGRLASLRQEIAVVKEEIDGISTNLAVLCVEIGKARDNALESFSQAVRAAKKAQRSAVKNQASAVNADEADALKGSVDMMFEVAVAVLRIGQVEPNLAKTLDGEQPEYLVTMKSFAATMQSIQQNAAENLTKAIKAYKKAASRADADSRWPFQIQEIMLRMQRFTLTGQQEDLTAAGDIRKSLEKLKDKNPEVKSFLAKLGG